MATRRERLKRKLVEKRREWAANRAADANARLAAARSATEGIPFGQPILVGHHSEARHRAALKRHAGEPTPTTTYIGDVSQHVAEAVSAS